MWRAFGRGDAATAVPQPYEPSRVSVWLANQDWERHLGLRYDNVVLPVAAGAEGRSVVDWPVSVVPEPVVELLPGPDEDVVAETSNLELVHRLEDGLVHGGFEAFLDGLRAESTLGGPPEELIQLENVVVAPSFVAFDLQAGQPVGDPSVFDEPVAPRRPKPIAVPVVEPEAVVSVSFARIARPVMDLPAGEPVGSPSVFDERVAPRLPERLVPPVDELEAVVLVSFAPIVDSVVDLPIGEPVGGPGVFDDDLPVRPATKREVPTEAVVPPQFVPVQFVRLVPPVSAPFVGQPVGDPGIEDGQIESPKISPELRPIALEFDGEYRIAASLRPTDDEYSVAAYSLNSGDENDAVRNTDDAAEEELPPDPLGDIISEILQEEEPAEDPNTLELPLVIPPDPRLEALRAGEPVGDPGVFDFSLTAGAKPASVDANGEDEDVVEGEEPSSPIAREVNRLSEKVESILSTALARPAPAINFSDELEKIAERSRTRKRKKEEAANRLPSEAVDDNIARSADRDGGLKMTEYKVQFEIFEGPLDLLLYLVKKQEVDIYEVNLTQIAEEFIKYIELMRSFDLEVAGEFLVMASTLMYIKSKELLPVEQQSQLDDEEDEDDPRWELIRQLVEYKKFKDAAADFKRMELAQEDVFPNNPPKPDFPVQKLKAKVSVFDLLGAVNRVLERIDAKESREIFADRWTVSEKIEQIRNEIIEKERVKFFDLFEDALSRSEVVATFLALLELIKLKVIVVEQPEVFSDIDICKAPPGHKLNLDEPDETDLPLGENEPAPMSEFDAPEGDEE